MAQSDLPQTKSTNLKKNPNFNHNQNKMRFNQILTLHFIIPSMTKTIIMWKHKNKSNYPLNKKNTKSVLIQVVQATKPTNNIKKSIRLKNIQNRLILKAIGFRHKRQ